MDSSPDLGIVMDSSILGFEVDMVVVVVKVTDFVVADLDLNQYLAVVLERVDMGNKVYCIL